MRWGMTKGISKGKWQRANGKNKNPRSLHFALCLLTLELSFRSLSWVHLFFHLPADRLCPGAQRSSFALLLQRLEHTGVALKRPHQSNIIGWQVLRLYGERTPIQRLRSLEIAFLMFHHGVFQ